ncbi:hypothetical protein FHR32_006906 [Streptosporangium album]|uniref:Nudix hydrolase domain-containing protein n=1 Tax=Streptosporangium album TaxID=47479 RepID=A0A7W7S270_9ACTN|nr:hypothetical protein [Streptosporangium album]MBB4942520.1 hypothetical protein [Streptosporangium album]
MTTPSPEGPTGQVRKAPSVSCVFICHDGHGRVLLARRGAGARGEPGTWDCGAGALEYGEPHKFDELGWFTPDALPYPLHSQLAESLRLFASR